MNCADFERRLHKILDARIPPTSDFQLSHHANRCAECRQNLASSSILLDGLELFEVPELPDSFARTTVSKVIPNINEAERSRLKTAWNARAIFAGGVIAAALSLVMMFPFLFHGGRQAAVERSIQPRGQWQQQTLRQPEHEMAPRNPATDGSRKEMRLDVATDPNPSPEFQGAGLAAGISLSSLPKLTEISEQIDSDTIPGVRPIRSSFSVAFGLLRGTLPGSRFIES